MLPDFPELKRKLEKREVNKAYRASHDGSVIAMMTKSTLFEGYKWRMVYPDGTVKESELRKAEALVTISDDEYAQLSHAGIVEKLDRMMTELNNQIVTGVFDELNEKLEASGQVVKTNGEPVSPKYLMEVFKKCEINFDKHRRPILPTIVAGPSMAEEIRRVMKESEADPNLKEEFETIIADQYEHWRLRESLRKLVG